MYVKQLRVPDLARDVVAVDVGLLEEHVQAPLVLSQGVTGNPYKVNHTLVIIVNSCLTPLVANGPRVQVRLTC